MAFPPDGRGGLQGLRDSLIISFATALVSVLIGAPAAYSLARFKIGGENLSFWILSTRMFPPVASALPLFLIFKHIRFLDTHLALIIANTIFNLPFVIWLFKGFFEDLPVELEEAARIDGCSFWGSFVRIALPLITPGLVVTTLFSFVFAWNEFMFALILTFTPRAKTLPIIAASTMTSESMLWGKLTVLGTLIAVPSILMTLLAQKYIVRGLTAEALK